MGAANFSVTDGKGDLVGNFGQIGSTTSEKCDQKEGWKQKSE
jgi:hypothetical protein